jgi:hypothetical protein
MKHNHFLKIASVLLLFALLLSACVPIQPPSFAQSTIQVAGQPPALVADVVESAASYQVVFPTPTPVPTSAASEAANAENEAGKEFVAVNITNSRVNVRSAANQTASIVGKANPGDVFEVVGKSEDGSWIQVCCVAGAAPQTSGWVAAALMRSAKAEEAQAPRPVNSAASTTPALLLNDLAAEWDVDWQCGSNRCTIDRCSATVNAVVKQAPNQQWLPIEHNVTWDKSCFSTDSWTFDVDRFTGKERSGEYTSNFLYAYWTGASSDVASGVLPLDDERGVLVRCVGPVGVEIPEGNGWTSVYEGATCHDLRTGMMVYLKYTKKWLFSGEFDGAQYERAFFGDTETLEQRLVKTNVELSFVEKNR